MSDLNILADFDSISKSDWLKRVEKDLKGRQVSDLNWEIPGADTTLQIDPFAHADDFTDLPQSLALKADNSWAICEDIEVKIGNYAAANKQALTALMGGANAIRFKVEKYPSAKVLQILLKDIELEYIAVYFSEETGKANPLKFLKDFQQVAIEKGNDAAILRGGVSYRPDARRKQDLIEIVDWVCQHLPKFKVLEIDGTIFFESSENCVQELINIIVIAEKYCQILANSQSSIISANGKIIFRVGIGIGYFIEIAKLRALKLLWANVLKAYIDESDTSITRNTDLAPSIHACLLPATQVEDVHTNKIRATTQAMSAVMGGVDSLTVAPSDALTSGESSDFSRRIARNVHHLLQMESYLDKVVDPAAGSYYIEKLTGQMAEAVWKQFQKRVKKSRK